MPGRNETYPFPVDVVPFDAGSRIPNHPEYPLLVYRSVSAGRDLSDHFASTFRQHGWGGTWLWSVFDYHHFHPDAFEVLGVASGSATLILGGPQGRAFDVSAGDVLLLPPGTGHKRERSSMDFQVVGAYPHGQEHYSTERSLPDPPEAMLEQIRTVPKPERDPVRGVDGPCMLIW